MHTSWKKVRYLINDPRTTLLSALIVNLCVMGSTRNASLIATAIFVAILLSSVARPRGIIVYIFLESLFIFFADYGALLGTNFAVAFLMSVGFWMARFTITAGIGFYIVYSINTNKLSVALRKMFLPKKFVSAIMVMIRFLPTAFQELKAIYEAMRLRGIMPGGLGPLIHPLTTAQYLLVPFLAGVVRIADDLAASAVIRGLGSTDKPSTLSPTNFCFNDIVILTLLAALCIVRIWNPELNQMSLIAAQ